MDYRLTADQEKLRAEVREFLSEDPALAARSFLEDGWIAGFDLEFSRRMAERGWIGLTWPKKYGGAERSYLDRLLLTEELLMAGAPVAGHWFGDRQIGPALLAHGSEEQRREFLPRIIAGEISFCIGMSEPNAGSDLAGLQTKAELDGDEFVIRGQKTWTSFAEHADYCYLVARTEPGSVRHKGVSELLVPMDAPGIEFRPIMDMVGESHFGELFFDEVRVPATCVIGTLGRGFYQIMEQLDYERSGIERLISNYPLWRDVKALARERGLTKDAALRDRIADIEIAWHAGRGMIYRVAQMLSDGVLPNHEAAVAKTYCTSLEQRIADLAASILGPEALLAPGSQGAPLAGRVARGLLYAPAYTIQGGTNNILKNIIATRGLGLPAR
ncbi:MAG: acyl-CoA dehydrogenase [bacterium]|nr:acyl-CoA dehydrogenase [bacterium]